MANDLRTFSIDEARSIALAAQGFAIQRPKVGTVDVDDFERVVRQINIVQIDSINVLVRAQYMPFFSRLGVYPLEMLHRYAYETRNVFEYGVHVASFVPIDHLPMIRHRMTEWQPWRQWAEMMAEHPGIAKATTDEIERRGPLEVADIENKGDRYGRHWSTSTAKLVLETSLHQGVLAVSDRLRSARRYDLFERVVPSEILSVLSLTRIEAHREMMRLAIRSLGIGTVGDCADYYRIKRTEASAAIRHLIEAGEVERVSVEGVKSEMFAVTGIEAPRNSLNVCAIVSPFDPVAWFRNRLEWLFDFEYRIEIYTPAKKRKYGYYVLPFLMDNRFVARVDLKADRRARVLRVPSAFLEAGCDEEVVAENLASELRLMADWLGMDRIVIGRRGPLTRPLRAAVKSG